jgi:hypothetical protein
VHHTHRLRDMPLVLPHRITEPAVAEMDLRQAVYVRKVRRLYDGFE